MANILLRYPNAGAPTATITLRESLAVVHWANIRPIQFQHVSRSGKLYVYEISANEEQEIELAIDSLHEADDGSYSGLTSLQTFLGTTLNWSQNSFDLTDADSVTWTVQYVRGFPSFREGAGPSSRKATRFSGRLFFRKVL